MFILRRAACRMYQRTAFIVSPLLRWRTPQALRPANGLGELADILQSHGITRYLLIHGKTVGKLGIVRPLLTRSEELGLTCVEFDDVAPDPTVEMVEQARQAYLTGNCSAIVAVGGGSPMDCAKAVAARIARPDKSVCDMRGLLKIRRKTPPIYAVPTTSGSGSETTLAAVICDPKTQTKFAINDPVLIPSYVVLDASLTRTLSPEVTAQTGMDALTHAVEAYIGHSNTSQTRAMAARAVKKIFRYLPEAYADGDDLEERRQMQEASYCAGVAFTRAYVGYVHAIAHTLGAKYHIPHGLANAVILSYVLECSFKQARRELAELGKYSGESEVTDNRQQAAERFVRGVKKLRNTLGIPEHLPQIQAADIPEMARKADREANPLYPVPRLLNVKELERLYRVIAGLEANPWEIPTEPNTHR